MSIAAIQVKLVMIQVFSSSQMRQRAINQQLKSKDIPARRGSIYDRNGKLLATDNIFYEIVADPQQLESLDKVDSALCQVFNRPPGFYLNKICPYINRRFVYLERKVSPPLANRLKEKEIKGIYFTPIYSRSYPYGTVASTLIGCVDNQGKGVAGIELYYDSFLTGIPSQKLIFTDGFGENYPLLCYSTGEPIPGDDIYLTIDIELQNILETELRKTMVEHNAKSASGILMDPKTGEILAMASLPNFDPNEYYKYPSELRKNRNITDPYEPGSIFKLVTFAAALAESVVSCEDTIDTKRGTINICGRTVSDVHSLGKITAREVIIHSSNVGIVLIAQNLDKIKFYEYIRKFGFGTPTNVDFSAESPGILRPPNKWWGTTMATLPMGYELSATPIQIVSAFSAIANKGILMRPFIVSRINKFNGKEVLSRKPLRIRSVIPRWVVDTMSNLLRAVVTDGTAKSANSEIIKIAGKTGTSHKVKIGEKGYRSDAYYASFAGYAPYDEPFVAGIIVVDEPDAGFHYGGQVAAPTLKTVLEKSINSGIFPAPEANKLYVHHRNQQDLSIVPNLKRTTPTQARKILSARNLDAKFYGVGNVVIDQSPQPGRAVEPGTVVILHLHQIPVENKHTVIIPDVVGLTLRKAIEILSPLGIPVRVEGRGIVVEQIPAPQTISDSNLVSILMCKLKGELVETDRTEKSDKAIEAENAM